MKKVACCGFEASKEDYFSGGGGNFQVLWKNNHSWQHSFSDTNATRIQDKHLVRFSVIFGQPPTFQGLKVSRTVEPI